MDRSRRAGVRQAPLGLPEVPPVPASSRLTVRGKKNRRRVSLWSRLPRPRAIANACGRALRRSLPALAATAALAGVGSGLWLGYQFITTSERFAIDDIQITGVTRLDAETVRAALPVRIGDNVFSANLDAIAERLRAQPWIASATARRILPSTLVVEIREYEPIAIVALGELYLVDSTGRPFKRVALDAGEGAGLPIVTGFERSSYLHDPATTGRSILSALEVLRTWHLVARPAIGEIHANAHGGFSLHTYDHATAIELGSATRELAARMRTFDAAWADLTETERARARAIHLDARADLVTVAFKE